MNWLFKRLSEPSSYAGLAGLLTFLPQAIATRDPQAIAGALASLAAVVAPEQAKQA